MRLSYTAIKEIAIWWRKIGGMQTVEVAALEPLLWSDGHLRIEDVVAEFKEQGFTVSMTSNGALLARHAHALKKAGLDLLRISWHSTIPETYRKITGGGKLSAMMDGLHAAIDAELILSINRVLLRGHTFDLKDQLQFTNHHRLRLKLLDLYWTPDSAEEYKKYYISPEETLEELISIKYLAPITQKNTDNNRRDRAIFSTPNQGRVEYKAKSSAKKDKQPCMTCTHKNNCLEGYADYVRVFPNMTASLCYMRQDLAAPIIGNGVSLDNINDEIINKAPSIPLRLVLEGRCNFNCGFPESTTSWCLKQGRGFQFPSRSGVIKIDAE